MFIPFAMGDAVNKEAAAPPELSPNMVTLNPRKIQGELIYE